MKYDLKDFVMHRGCICYLAAIADIMYYNGLRITEDELHVVTTALKMKAEHIDRQFEFRCADLHDDFNLYRAEIKKLGWTIEENINMPQDEFDSKITSNSISKHPLLIAADVFYLPYHTYFHQIHECHIITILDKKEDDILVADHLILGAKNKQYMGCIDYCVELFDLSKISDVCHNLCWMIEQEIEDVKVSDEMIIGKLRETAAELICGEGPSGINALKNYYNEIFLHRSEADIKKELIRMNKMLALGGGPYPARQLLGIFFESHKQYDTLGLAKKYYELAKMWRVIAKLSIKGSILCDHDVWAKIEKKLEEVKLLEIECAELVLKI